MSAPNICDEPSCIYCGEKYCSRNCDWSDNGPPDSYWEDRAESADRAAVREAAILKDAGR